MAQDALQEWIEIAAATYGLAIESANVAGLRIARAASGGPRACSEAWLMCSEKFSALAELQAKFLIGTLGVTPAAATQGTVKYFRRKVAANCRRLSKQPN